MPELKVLHRAIRGVAGWSIWSFFSDVQVIGAENVPRDGPLIVVATHHNMMIDPAVLSTAFPHGRLLNYWAKASLFATPIGNFVLSSSGCIPVERKSKDNQTLFRGTFEALARGEAIALFPEGTSYTEPRIVQVKDGMSWAALEYVKWAKENPEKASKKDLMVVPVGIIYTNKSKYRSQVIMEIGKPIRPSDYAEEFLSGAEAAPRATVKKLTQRIETELIRATINAPDWDTLFAARMSRDLLWPKDKSIALQDFVGVSQILVNIFSTADISPNFNVTRKRLLEYYSLLETCQLTNSVLSSLPLPTTLDPRRPIPVPSRLYTLIVLIRDTLSCLLRAPFVLVPLMVHAPVYMFSRYGAKLVEDEEETQAQNKIVFALLLLTVIYSCAFLFLWAMFWFTPAGALLAAGVVWLFAFYHVKMIDDVYEHGKRLVAAWRILVGVWTPKSWDLAGSSLTQYLTPRLPPENPWIERKPSPSPTQSAAPSGVLSPEPSASSSKSGGGPSSAKAPSANTNARSDKRSYRRPPSRRIVRHVLRARVKAAHALAEFFHQLERDDGQRMVWVSEDLAATVHNVVRDAGPGSSSGSGNNNLLRAPPNGTSYGRQVVEKDDPAARGSRSISPGPRLEAGVWVPARTLVAYLRACGARVAALADVVEGQWAAVSTDAEGLETEGYYSSDATVQVKEEREEPEWVVPSREG